ncbi:MAG: trypsin-like serine peptidase [Acidimicrobiales bacterium]
MSVLSLDDPVSNTDLQVEEREEEASFVGGGQQDEAGPDGLEAIAADFNLDLGSGGPELESLGPVAPSLAGLRSATEASYDMPVVMPSGWAESVIGDDGRRRINNTDDYPWRVHASLLITARDGSRWIGTAFFISPRVLATAGHNLYFHGPNEARKGWARSIQVMPGRNEDELPFGSAISTKFYSGRGWVDSEDNSPDPEYDYGAIVLDESEPLGNETGWIGFGTYSDSTVRSVTGNLSGYPGDLGNGREQWYMARRIDSVSNRQIFYDIDTAGGQSGSAVYRINNGSRYAIGIHAYGTGSRPLNAATRINRPAFDNLLAWKNANQ